MAKSKKVEEASIVEEENKNTKSKKRTTIEKVVKEKQPEKALFIQRFAAFILDVFIVSMVASMIAYPFLDMNSIDKLSESSTQIVEDYMKQEISIEEYTNESISVSYEMARKQGILSLITIFLNILYFVVFQIKNDGQTIGKKLLKIKVSSNDGVFEVKATNGNNHLGGDDFDEAIMDYLVSEFKKENGVDLSKDKMAMQRLKETAEKAKKDLSGMVSTQVSAPFIAKGDDGEPLHLDMTLTRAKFEDLISDLVESTLEPVRKALKDAKMTKKDIDKVILVGGSTRVPMVYDLITKELGKEPSREVNPDEVVAMGAAIQGGVLTGDVNDIVLLDVTPLSLGIETLGGVMTTLIPRNTTIPVSKSEVFSTAADNQPAVDVHVLQGERPMAADNKTLGRFQLGNIPPAPRGVPQIEVKFDIDANGIVNVTAKDLGTNKEQSITITSSTNLTDEEIEKMRKEAEENKEADEKRKEEAEVKNEAEQLVFQTEKAIKDLGDKADKKEKEEAEDLIKDLKKALEKDDMDDIKKYKDKLQEKAMALATKVYEQAAKERQQEESADEEDKKKDKKKNKKSDDDVQEADIEEE